MLFFAQVRLSEKQVRSDNDAFELVILKEFGRLFLINLELWRRTGSFKILEIGSIEKEGVTNPRTHGRTDRDAWTHLKSEFVVNIFRLILKILFIQSQATLWGTVQNMTSAIHKYSSLFAHKHKGLSVASYQVLTRLR